MNVKVHRMYWLLNRTISLTVNVGFCIDNFYKGNKIDYYHFYIELPGKKQGERKRSSPNFRKEAYKMNDYTLVAYIGDHNVVEKREETLRQKREKILGSLSMHANLQEMAKNRTNTSQLYGVKSIPGRGYNTISGNHQFLHFTFTKRLSASFFFTPFYIFKHQKCS